MQYKKGKLNHCVRSFESKSVFQYLFDLFLWFESQFSLLKTGKVKTIMHKVKLL